jgi:hypothetical protein
MINSILPNINPIIFRLVNSWPDPLFFSIRESSSIYINIMIYLLIALAGSFKVPVTSTEEDLKKFYSHLEQFGMKVMNYGEKGLGIQYLNATKEAEVSFCIDSSLSIKDYDRFPLYEFIKDLYPIQRLIARILYEKFMGKRDGFQNQYIHSLPVESKHPMYWSKAQYDLFKKYNFYPSLENLFNKTEQYKMLYERLKKVYGIRPEMLEYDAYIWASGIVEERSFYYELESGGAMFILAPYLDLVNHWPNPINSSYPGSLLSETKHCLISGWNRTAGTEILFDYGKNGASVFFYRYKFVIESDPNFYIEISYKGAQPCDNCNYKLTARNINTNLLKTLTYDVGEYKNVTSDFRSYYLSSLNDTDRAVINKALLLYRKTFLSSQEFSKFPGLREARRENSADLIEKSILTYSRAIRKTVYDHLRVLDREILFSYYNSLF